MAEMACSKLPARSATDRGTARKRTNPLHNATPAMVMVRLKLKLQGHSEAGGLDRYSNPPHVHICTNKTHGGYLTYVNVKPVHNLKRVC